MAKQKIDNPSTRVMKCSLDGFQRCFLELETFWTLKDLRGVRSATSDEAALKVIQGKTASCNIAMPDGTWITDPAEMTIDKMEDIDLRLWGWILGSVYSLVQEIKSMGEVNGLLSQERSGPLQENKKEPTK